MPADHNVVDLALSDGRRVRVSPGHPTADGRPVGELRPGDPYDGSTVVSAERVRHGAPTTFDLLPSGPTGTYWANGVLSEARFANEWRGTTDASLVQGASYLTVSPSRP